jgi:hypothetical protein
MKHSFKKILSEIDYVNNMIHEEMVHSVKEGSGATRIFQSLQEKLPKIYLRPNNIIDLGAYSMKNIEDSLEELGYEFRKESEGKLHYFNQENSISLYLNPSNKKISLTP